ncbi:hypothetical protein JQC67_00260 [Aurantibacter crassamenti]|uniref:hypothetical protein n=1 Tax=Aurantibacter crassamenti TaxID=1837375 RepID=UPI001939A411|nr:hypothetical protein [Aurantibacter crassamenti]MBM1104557.1 hypothetical protein [Aurantibacter crassamenti]
MKIGDDVSSIHDASLFELESTSKALVLTRVTNSQMLNIVPLKGALVYNTDTNCVYAFNGSNWQNLCNDNAGSFSIIDNEDGSFTITSSDGTSFTSPNFSDLKGDTGPQGPAGIDGTEIQQEQTVLLASTGQTQFTTPISIIDSKKIEVYRNGIRIAFTTIDNNTIELESEISCYQNDSIRIVQIF